MSGDARSAPGVEAARMLRIGELRLDPGTGELCGPGGSERLDPKVMAVLLLLARHAEAVVPRHTFLDSIWADTVVTDDVLSRCIYQLRRHFCLAGGDESYKRVVETLPKRGYRLNAAVTVLEQPGEATQPSPAHAPIGNGRPGNRYSAAASAAHRPWRRTTLVLLTLAACAVPAVFLLLQPDASPRAHDAPVATIAVLPFADLSRNLDQRYLADGLAEEILDVLSRQRDVRVIARTSSFASDARDDLRAVASRLDASHVVEGSVRVAGNQVRVTARLVDATSGSPVWSRTYQRHLDQLFSLQVEIAGAVARALDLGLGSDRPALNRPPHPKAEEHYLQARYFHNRRGPGDAERARQHYEQAVALDPAHARAWAGLAGIYASLIGDLSALDAESGLEKMGEAAKRAVDLDPRLPTAQARFSQYLFMIGDDRRAAETVRRALDQHPEDVLTLAVAAGSAARDGRWDEALRLQRRAVALDPVAVINRSNLIRFLLRAGELDQAHQELLIVRELVPDPLSTGYPGAAQTIADVLILGGRYEEASAFVEQWPEGHERNRYLAMIYHALGRTAESAELIRQQPMPQRGQRAVSMAEVHAFRGERDEAFRWLSWTTQQMSADPASSTYHRRSRLRDLRSSAYLKSLHDDPRWAEWIASLSRPERRMATPESPGNT